MSAAVGSNPFARTSGFTQTADQSKSINGYYGNIDFPQEDQRVAFRKSVGKDLNTGNPYLEKENSIANFCCITQNVIAMVKALAPGRGLRALRIAFKPLDKNNNGLFDPSDFKFCMKQFGIQMTEEETFNLLKYFDTHRCGKISLNDVFHAMRSSSMNEKREKALEQAYKKLDTSGNEKVTIADLEANYDISPNPEF